MQVANAEALQQREKRVNHERECLLTRKTTLKAIFAGCVLSAVLIGGSCYFDKEAQSNPNQTEQVVKQNGSSWKPLAIFALIGVGLGVLSQLPKTSKKMNTLDRRQQIINSLKVK